VKIRGSAVRIATGYGLDGRGVGVRVLAAKNRKTSIGRPTGSRGGLEPLASSLVVRFCEHGNEPSGFKARNILTT
jgi:hypothetical protein